MSLGAKPNTVYFDFMFVALTMLGSIFSIIIYKQVIQKVWQMIRGLICWLDYLIG